MCGREASCSVYNHIPMCDCPYGYTGNAHVACAKIESMRNVQNQKFIFLSIQSKTDSKSQFLEPPTVQEDHCNPSPCGQNSHCSNVNHQAVCSCLLGYYGTPPACRRECSIDSDCINTKSCVNEHCIDPCAGSCAPNAECKVINHKAACYCPLRYTGDPFVRCTPIAIGNHANHFASEIFLKFEQHSSIASKTIKNDFSTNCFFFLSEIHCWLEFLLQFFFY